MVTLKSGLVLSSPVLDTQLVGDGHEHFEDGHEGRDLAEVAAADHLSVNLQAALVVLARHAATDLVESTQDVVRERLLSQLVIQVSQTLSCIIELPFGLRISCCELAALHQAIKGGFEDGVLRRDFFLLHSLCWQLLEELYAGLLRGSRWDLGVVVGLRGLHWETHHRSSDGGWWSVVIRDLLLSGSTAYRWWIIPAFLCSCWRRCNGRGLEGLCCRGSRTSLGITSSHRNIGARSHGGCCALVVEAAWIHGTWGSWL